jgi:hypothetical protein
MPDSTEKCPHCNQPMKKWVAADESTWGADEHQVCFNDDCPYYVKGWEWMRSQYNHTVSYRHRQNLTTGESGPLPVFSPNALRSGIID